MWLSTVGCYETLTGQKGGRTVRVTNMQKEKVEKGDIVKQIKLRGSSQFHF